MRTAKAKQTAKLLSWGLLLLFIVFLSLLIQSYWQTYKTKQVGFALADAKKMADAEGDWSHGMLDINEDYRGWLRIYGTGVDYPVVLGETNNTYLRRDFLGEWSIAGTLFLDETTNLEEDGNRIIYGHKMNDSTMFGDLKKYKDKEFFKENNIVKWEDQSGVHYYRIFAAMVVPGDSDAADFIDLQKWNNRISIEETRDMLKTIKDRACIHKELWNATDHTFMFLVTCDYTRTDGRLVLAAVSI